MLLLTSFPPLAEEGTGVVDCSGARSASPLAQEPQPQDTELAAVPKNSNIWSQIRGDIPDVSGESDFVARNVFNLLL